MESFTFRVEPLVARMRRGRGAGEAVGEVGEVLELGSYDTRRC